jgi:hypothetical protein
MIESLLSRSSPAMDLNKVSDETGNIAKGGVACPFPWRVHECLEAVEREGLSHIISWQPHGRAFTVHQPKLFVELILTRFFGQTKYASFQRQLNIYGFNRFLHGKDKGAYYHLCFVRGRRSLVRNMVRMKIKGNKSNRALTASAAMEEEKKYDFYNPIWGNHFEPSMPVQLVTSEPTERVISPVCLPAQANVTSSPFELSAPVATVSPSYSTTVVSSFEVENILIQPPLTTQPSVMDAAADKDLDFVSLEETDTSQNGDDISRLTSSEGSLVSDNDLDFVSLFEETGLIQNGDDNSRLASFEGGLVSDKDLDFVSLDDSSLLASFEGGQFYMLEEPTPAFIPPVMVASPPPCQCACHCAKRDAVAVSPLSM